MRQKLQDLLQWGVIQMYNKMATTGKIPIYKTFKEQEHIIHSRVNKCSSTRKVATILKTILNKSFFEIFLQIPL